MAFRVNASRVDGPGCGGTEASSVRSAGELLSGLIASFASVRTVSLAIEIVDTWKRDRAG